MEAREGQSSAAAAVQYTLPPSRFSCEDILFCIDVDPESLVEMKHTSVSGRPFTRLESIKQAILLFINAKLAMNPDHRFAYCSIGKGPTWLKKEFSSDVDSAIAAFRAIVNDSATSRADLTNLFKVATHEAKRSRAQNRILRVILLYCRSSAAPHHQWVTTQKLFTLDVVYLHDKPGPDNCPQKVYDNLVDALEQVSEYEGYIFESGQGLTRVLFRHMCVLLSHPQQRCMQDDIDIPTNLTKKSPTLNPTPPDQESVPVSSQ